MAQNPGFWLFARLFLLRNSRFSDLKTGILDFSDKLLGPDQSRGLILILEFALNKS